MSERKKLFLIVLSLIIIIFSIILLINFRINSYLSKEFISKYTINELYKSKEINYRLALDKKEKEIYETIIENFIEFNPNFEIDLSK